MDSNLKNGVIAAFCIVVLPFIVAVLITLFYFLMSVP